LKLSLVIPTYNRAALLRRLLLQLCDQTLSPAEFEVRIVDDGSPENVSDALLDLRTPYALHLLRQDNNGPAAARHAGVLAAQGELILFVDDDMQIGPDFVAQHVHAHANEQRAVVLGRIRADPALSTMPLFERWHSALLDRKAEGIRSGAISLLGNLLFTGNASLRRDDYLAVGGFDASLGHSEDVELGLRLEKSGVAFRFSEEAWTLHGSDHVSLAKWHARARRYGVYDRQVGVKHPDLRHASPWRFAFDLNPLARPFLAASLLAPRMAGGVAALIARGADLIDRAGFARPALSATTLAYAMEYFGGVREGAGSTCKAFDELVAFVARFEQDALAVLCRARLALAEDQAVMAHYEAKYGHHSPSELDLATDVVQKIGLQIMVPYRLMRALRESGSLLAAKVMSRLIRHLYGSDIHWDAELAPGVMIVHGMGLAVSHAARVERGCILFHNVTLGMGTDPVTRCHGAPRLERDVHVGPGATLIGPITVGAGSKVMAGAVLTRSVPPGSLVETPAPPVRPRISEHGSGAANGDLAGSLLRIVPTA
jgi:serine acetyltransferase/glycosyltransferase involved in cell wall biosynthesis